MYPLKGLEGRELGVVAVCGPAPRRRPGHPAPHSLFGRPMAFEVIERDLPANLACSRLTRPWNRLLKGAFDRFAAAVLTVVLSPALLAVALLVSADGGSAIYRQRRIGAGGRPFDCLKFRTMVPDAEHVLPRMLANDGQAAAEWDRQQKLRTDPRVTRLGEFLRRSSLDELPQLLNVLRGEMSLVGPRPIIRSEVARYGAAIGVYYEAKPGITGAWQVNGRSETTYEERVRLDVLYVRNWTPWSDVAILLKTLPAVLLQRGAL